MSGKFLAWAFVILFSGLTPLIAADAATETVVYSFKGGTDGSNPQSGLIYMHGALYGTSIGGGTNGLGTVFKVKPNGKEEVLYLSKEHH